MELELERCTVRSWQLDDAEPLARYANNRKIWRNLRDSFPHPYTRDDADDWVTIASAQQPETHFAIVVDGEAVGGIGLEFKGDVYRRSVELGYWLGEPYWGRGIATEAVGALTTWAFDALPFVRIYACVFSTNIGSVKVLEKAGYMREARLHNAVYKEGQVLDEFVYATWPEHWQQRLASS